MARYLVMLFIPALEVAYAIPANISDDNQLENKLIVKSKEEIINNNNNNNRIKIETKSLKGSINLKGGILDDLVLLKYNETRT